MKEQRIAIVTGANRGLGLETVRQLARKKVHCILTCRDSVKGQAALAQLASEDLHADFQSLDVADSTSIEKLVNFVSDKFGRIDILVNNAGIMPDDRDEGDESVFNTKVETIRTGMETNVYGPFQLCQRIIPLMQKNGYGRIVNLSSGMGQLSEMNGSYAAYRISKTAINAVTRIFSDETQSMNILVNSVCPGWVKTDMGGSNAELSLEEGVDSIVWLATLPDGGPNGGFFRERKKIAW